MKKKAKKSKPKKAKAKKASKPKAKKVLKAKSKAKSKKTASKKAKAKKKSAAGKPAMSVIPPPNSTLVGRVEDFYAQVSVVAFTVQKPFHVGDRMQVLGHTTNLEQVVDSMQIEHQAVSEAKPKDAVGIKVNGRARHGDYIFILK